jgi:hypothetical protein
MTTIATVKDQPQAYLCILAIRNHFGLGKGNKEMFTIYNDPDWEIVYTGKIAKSKLENIKAFVAGYFYRTN